MNPFHKIALESLKKNRTRTAVIITGVILSAAMISGVIVFAGSLQNFLVEGSIATKGDWYGMAEPVDKSRKENLEKISKVSATSSYQIKGYSKLDKHGNKYKPYIFVAAFDDDMYDTGMIKMIHGRKPKILGQVLFRYLMVETLLNLLILVLYLLIMQQSET